MRLPSFRRGPGRAAPPTGRPRGAAPLLRRLAVPPLIILGVALPAAPGLSHTADVSPGAARRPLAAAPDPVSWFRWPLGGSPVVTRAFDPPPQPWLPGHRGVDLAARPGDRVFAAAPGVVAFAGDLAGRGVVSVAHPGGIRTTYEPVRPLVAVGDEVAAGAPIGVLAAGHAGCPAPACLHWGARRADTYLNPLTLLGPPRLRLKPLEQ
ncbi:M23 family metallopeptidase [Luedemannella helvata]|uniref:M23ase beta-sheet core domain-containing protein n=1 Tax=Luedemannella helvata TaxID=349315 RepID=A0ABP4WMU1_9ACTN